MEGVWTMKITNNQIVIAKHLKRKFRSAAMLAAVLLSLSACGKPQPSAKPEATVLPMEQTHATVPAEEAPWQEQLADELLETYGVLPEYYEELGDGSYQVYAEVGGEILPFAILNAATGEYHLVTTEGN